MVAVHYDSLDLRVGYAWEGNGRDGDAEAKFRIAITPDKLSVAKMWR